MTSLSDQVSEFFFLQVSKPKICRINETKKGQHICNMSIFEEVVMNLHGLFTSSIMIVLKVRGHQYQGEKSWKKLDLNCFWHITSLEFYVYEISKHRCHTPA